MEAVDVKAWRKAERERLIALRMGLPVHDKAESQDICFVEGGDYRDVLADPKVDAVHTSS